MSAALRDREGADDHAVRQAEMYAGIWSADPAYGTRQADVEDTVAHRIVPHMSRVLRKGITSVVDFGAGDGRFLQELHRAGWCHLGIGIDLHEPKHRDSWLDWQRKPLWQASIAICDFVISTDTLEHMPPEMVEAVLAKIAAHASHGFLRISTRQDIYGTERGLHLHETVEEPEWWLAHCKSVGIEPSSWRVYPGHALEVWW